MVCFQHKDWGAGAMKGRVLRARHGAPQGMRGTSGDAGLGTLGPPLTTAEGPRRRIRARCLSAPADGLGASAMTDFRRI